MMFNSVKYGKFFFFAGCLLMFSASAGGQDLGSSSGLFRSPNPTVKRSGAAAEKKSASKSVRKTGLKEPRTKVSALRVNSAKTTAKETTAQTAAPAAVKQSDGKQSDGNQQSNDIIITVGKPTVVKPSGGKSDALYDRAITEGNAARDARRYPAAETAYRRALNLKPNDSRAIYGLGNLFSDQQRWEEAEKAYRQAIALEPDSPEAHIALSYVLTQPVVSPNLGDRYVEAEKLARRAIQLDANNAAAYDQLGVALELRGIVDVETQTAYRRAVELDPNFALAYAHLGRLLRRIGSTNDSAAAYRDAVRLSSDVPTMILVADVMQSQQRYADSEQLLRRALRDDPKNPTALYLLARALMTRSSFDEAERLLKRSVEVSPDSFVSYTILASLYSRRNDFTEAERTLMRALRVVSNNEKKRLAQEFETVGDGFMRAGKNSDAARVYRKAISLNADKTDLVGKLSKAEKS